MRGQTYSKNAKQIMILFMLTYMVSYITRINYGAIIAEMVKVTGMQKSELSLAVTGSFVTYGTGQIISGFCGDRFSPKKLVFAALLTTCFMNILIPFCKSSAQMLAVWCVNGFAQAFMWPPLVVLMTRLLTTEEYNRDCVVMTWGSSFGTILIYLLSPLLIALFTWRSVFFFSASCGVVMAILWWLLCHDVKVEKKPKSIEKNVEKTFLIKPLLTPLMCLILFAVILQGSLRDGVTTWMPSYISETYNLSSAVSILSGVVLPVFSIFCVQFASRLYVRFFKNPVQCAGIIFGAGALSALALCLFTGRNTLLSVVFSALLTGCMHGVNLMLVCILPPFFKKYGNVSTASGVINSCTYIGSAVSTYGIALLTEKTSWSVTLFVWVGIAAAGALICGFCAAPWKKANE